MAKKDPIEEPNPSTIIPASETKEQAECLVTLDTSTVVVAIEHKGQSNYTSEVDIKSIISDTYAHILSFISFWLL
jgi:hypothetical protein